MRPAPVVTDSVNSPQHVWNLEENIGAAMRRRGVDLPPTIADSDSLFPTAISWLASEGPIDVLPDLAAAHPEKFGQNPYRQVLAALSADRASVAENEIEAAAVAYLTFAGYPADAAGAALAAGDYYFARVRDGLTHPLAAVACVAFLSGSLRDRIEPEWLRQLHEDCARLADELMRSKGKSAESATITAAQLASDWFAFGRVPRL